LTACAAIPPPIVPAPITATFLINWLIIAPYIVRSPVMQVA
jgi:hypothetical protein